MTEINDNNDRPTQNELIEKPVVKPVVLVDRETLIDYGGCIRRIFVGLANELCSGALVCPPDCQGDRATGPGIELIQYPLFKLPVFRGRDRRVLMDKLRAFRPTVVHCFSKSKAKTGLRIARELNIPFIMTFNTPPGGLFRVRLSRHYCSSIIASSGSIAEQLKSSYKSLADRIEQVNIGTFVTDDASCFSNPGQVTSLVAVADFNSVFDFEPLLRAVRHLAIDGYEFIMALIGSGSGERKLRRQIRSLGLSHIVPVVPHMRPLRSIFSGADIYIQPQDIYGINRFLLEAMSVGLAVACSNRSEEEALAEGRTAVFFNPEQELSIYNALSRLLSRKEYARQLAENAQQYLREHNSVSKMAGRLLDIYRKSQQWYSETQR